jgi:uncharacterized protein with FMN-binding domain
MRKFILCILASIVVILAAILDKAAGTPGEAARLAATAPTAGARTALGPAIPLAHGIVQVKVTAIGSRITDVEAVQLPHDNNHSWEDSLHAATVLRSEILSKQTTDLHVVSGATYTSEGYLQSLNAALDLAAPPAPKMSPTPQVQ